MLTVRKLLFKEEVDKYLNCAINGEEVSIIDGYGTKITMVNEENSIKERLNEFIDFLDKEIDKILKQKDGNDIAKYTYANTCENIKENLINIVNGRRYDEYDM